MWITGVCQRTISDTMFGIRPGLSRSFWYSSGYLFSAMTPPRAGPRDRELVELHRLKHQRLAGESVPRYDELREKVIEFRRPRRPVESNGYELEVERPSGLELHLARSGMQPAFLDHQNDEDLALRIERPNIGAVVIVLLGKAPIARGVPRPVAVSTATSVLSSTLGVRQL